MVLSVVNPGAAIHASQTRILDSILHGLQPMARGRGITFLSYSQRTQRQY